MLGHGLPSAAHVEQDVFLFSAVGAPRHPEAIGGVLKAFGRADHARPVKLSRALF